MMTKRQTLILLSGIALGISISAALPILGRFFPGIGKGGAIALVVLAPLGFALTPIEQRGYALLAIVSFGLTFLLSALTGGF